jgi:hypothetical protein
VKGEVSLVAGFLGGLVPGCGSADRPSKGQSVSTSQPAESLILATRTGVEIWYTLSRPSAGADGKPCVERGIEVRRNGERIAVPLLYTGDAPTLLNDSTMRAILWTNCRPVAAYLVDLRTGRPVREQVRGPS